jgi:hypothetical protein
MFLLRYELGFYIPEDDILHSRRRVNLKYYMKLDCLFLVFVLLTGKKKITTLHSVLTKMLLIAIN